MSIAQTRIGSQSSALMIPYVYTNCALLHKWSIELIQIVISSATWQPGFSAILFDAITIRLQLSVGLDAALWISKHKFPQLDISNQGALECWKWFGLHLPFC